MNVLEIYNLIIPFIKSKKKQKQLRKVIEKEYDRQTHCKICGSKIAIYAIKNNDGIICHKCIGGYYDNKIRKSIRRNISYRGIAS